MATRSSISIHENGIIKSIYCHFDGYLSHNGNILLNHYNTKEKVEELVNLGDLSILGAIIGEKHDFNESSSGLPFELKPCYFYGRDRNDKWNTVQPREYLSYFEYFSDEEQEYNYLFTDNEWYLCSYKGKRLLKEVMNDKR